MRVRPAILCGAVFAAAALGACWAGLALAPALLTDRIRTRLTACPLPGLRCAPVGVFLHQREIGAPPDPALGPPDPTTLASSAWIDLSAGPMRLTVPPTGSRPFAVLVLDGKGDRIGVASPRSVGRAGAAIVVAGPRDTTRPSAGAALLRSGADTAWIVARFAVAGEADLSEAHALQDGLRLTREPR